VTDGPIMNATKSLTELCMVSSSLLSHNFMSRRSIEQCHNRAFGSRFEMVEQSIGKVQYFHNILRPNYNLCKERISEHWWKQVGRHLLNPGCVCPMRGVELAQQLESYAAPHPSEHCWKVVTKTQAEAAAEMRGLGKEERLLHDAVADVVELLGM
jgi:hypothetical protein